MFKKTIELESSKGSLHFNVDTFAYENYLKDLIKGKPTGAAKELCSRCVVDSDKELLNEFINQGAAVAIASSLVEEFGVDHEFTVKK